ncbi:MAG: NAD+ synthase [Nitrosomonas sp.]|nr:NAD+ synthase [Nitrosomonas sp.]
MKIALAQINPVVGDLRGNIDKILDACKQAHAAQAGLLITPEMALTGHPAQDWLLRKDFISACEQALRILAVELHHITLVIGHPAVENDKLFNAASVIRSGKIIARYHKNYLSVDNVFNEQRYFEAGDRPCTFVHDGLTFGLVIGEDIYRLPYLQAIQRMGAQALLAMHASPYCIGQHAERLRIATTGAVHTAMPGIHVNLVGGQDELVFDGASFVIDGAGEPTHQFDAFQEAIGIIEFSQTQPVNNIITCLPEQIASVYAALCLGVRDFIDKNGFPGVLIGLSGGVDSALVLAIAADALGCDKIRTVMLPSPYTADISLQDADTMARNLGVTHIEIPIDPVFTQCRHTLSAPLHSLPAVHNPATEENLQARIRGILLMALSNQSGLLLLNTSNKSETAVGYSTLYGDMAGGFAVLKDVSKTMVYALCHYRNQVSPIIPERILQRPPSAELRPNQTDQDSLPPYSLLDAIIEAYIEQGRSIEEIVAMNYPQTLVQQVVSRIHGSEYKRHQAAPGIRLTRRDFGASWQFPLTSRFLK